MNLPEEYYIEASVVISSEYGSEATTYAQSEKDGWIYIKLGYDGEQYVYKPLSSGKYIEYKYDTQSGAYKPTMISSALQEQIDAGNVPLDSVSTSKESIDAKKRILDTYFVGYKSLSPSLIYEGEESYNGVKCDKYYGKVNAIAADSEYEFLIDPKTGLAFRYENTTNTSLVNTHQITEITSYSEEARIPAVE